MCFAMIFYGWNEKPFRAPRFRSSLLEIFLTVFGCHRMMAPENPNDSFSCSFTKDGTPLLSVTPRNAMNSSLCPLVNKAFCVYELAIKEA